MPDLNDSNRERLLRLIEGGPEVAKEAEVQRGAKPVLAEKNILPAKPASFHPEMMKLLLPLGILVLILAGLFFVFGILRSMKPAARSSNNAAAVPSATEAPAAAVVEDESGVGLRLVGVDSSEPPVALLEDLKTGKTYFAKTNDRVKNVRVKQIFRNKIEVSVNGRTMELS